MAAKRETRPSEFRRRRDARPDPWGEFHRSQVEPTTPAPVVPPETTNDDGRADARRERTDDEQRPR